MAVVSPHEESMRSVSMMRAHGEPGRMSGDVVRGAMKMADAAVAVTAATTMTATTVATAAVAAAREGVRCERQGAERENCGQRQD